MEQYDSDSWYLAVLINPDDRRYIGSVVVWAFSKADAVQKIKENNFGNYFIYDVYRCGNYKPELVG